MDNAICTSLTSAKRSIGLPWAFIFELHGWWHILTGIGAYICISPFYFLCWTLNTNRRAVIALVEYLTSEEAGEPLGRGLAWPATWIVNGSVGLEKTAENEHETLNEDSTLNVNGTLNENGVLNGYGTLIGSGVLNGDAAPKMNGHEDMA